MPHQNLLANVSSCFSRDMWSSADTEHDAEPDQEPRGASLLHLPGKKKKFSSSQPFPWCIDGQLHVARQKQNPLRRLSESIERYLPSLFNEMKFVDARFKSSDSKWLKVNVGSSSAAALTALMFISFTWAKLIWFFVISIRPVRGIFSPCLSSYNVMVDLFWYFSELFLFLERLQMMNTLWSKKRNSFVPQNKSVCRNVSFAFCLSLMDLMVGCLCVLQGAVLHQSNIIWFDGIAQSVSTQIAISFLLFLYLFRSTCPSAWWPL